MGGAPSILCADPVRRRWFVRTVTHVAWRQPPKMKMGSQGELTPISEVVRAAAVPEPRMRDIGAARVDEHGGRYATG